MDNQFQYRESPVRQRDRQLVAEWLGREPRGLSGIAVRNIAGDPAVVRVASLVDGDPFPTLFWLVDRELTLALDRLEAGGTIARLQAQVLESPALIDELRADHRACAALRESLMPDQMRRELASRGLLEGLNARGIGGIVDFSRIKCLHACYGAHLVRRNVVGRLLETGYL